MTLMPALSAAATRSRNACAGIIVPVGLAGLASKYPPAEPGALVLEPLKAAYPCRSNQASLHSVNASQSADPPQLGKLRCLLFATFTWYALISHHHPSLKLPFVCLATHDSELHRWAGGSTS